MHTLDMAESRIHKNLLISSTGYQELLVGGGATPSPPFFL